MLLVADESVDFGIIQRLRKKGISVISISEEISGIKDSDVLAIAFKNKCILITEDKDFGELTYRLKLKHYGILLIRLGELPRDERIKLAIELVENHHDELLNNFSVLNKRGVRIKTAHHKKMDK
jgi:predicted nuclease of predicted toxin-antitoxin system